MVWVWIAGAALSQIKPLWQKFQRSRAQSWPSIQGKIDRAVVEEKRGFLGLKNSHGPQFTASIYYAYFMGGESYAGVRTQEFTTEEAGLEYVRALGGRSILIAVNPAKPAESRLLDEAIETVQSSRPTAPNPFLAQPPVPAWLKPLLWPVIVLSFIGFVVSLWVHLNGLAGREVVPEQYFFVLHVGAIVLWFPAVFVANRRVKGVANKDLWKAVLNGSSAWMRYVLYALSAYGAILGISYFGKELTDSPYSSKMPWLWFSVGWMVFYFGSFAITYSSIRASEEPVTSNDQHVKV
jgi:hypothetical protein